ncbi:MAG: choice-of-anchor D domain-containing protein [Actinomycetota bacterium]|nr:choice-of-anchor D domain-containing protein [Actinomycetota bacterium]
MRLAQALCLATLALIALPAGSAMAAPIGDPAPPQINVNPGSHDFGIVELDRGGQQMGFNVQNAGADWAPVSARIDGPDAGDFWFVWDGCSGGTLAPGSTCGLGIHFNPGAPRDYHATLAISSGDSEFTAELTGTGGLRQVTATPNPVDFGTAVVGDGTTRSVTLQNTGNVFFQSMVAIPVGGDVGAFRLIEDGCSMRLLAPIVACKLKLRFAPYEADNAEATLAIIGEGNPTLVTLRGVGVDPPRVDPAKADPAPGDTALTAAATGAPAEAKPESKSKSKPKAAKRAARVAFNWRRGLPAPYQGKRIDLGVAHCKGAPTCRVSVRAWLVTSGVGEAAGTRTTSVRRSTWWIGNGSPVSLWLPAGLRGAPARLIVDLRTKAADRPVGVQRLNVRLLEGVRRGGAVVATPTG